MEPMMTTMAPAAFYYYNPDPSPEARQHGHFIAQAQQMPIYPMVPTLPSTPVYAQQPQQMQPQPMRAVTSVPANIMTPVSSPPAPACQPLAHKPTILLETELCDAEGNRYPSTPPLSTTSSTIGSPGSCDMLATPLNPMFSGLDGFKENCVADIASDKFATLTGWTSCASPPLTPVYIHPQTQPTKVAPSSIPPSVSVNTNDLLSVSACPSLSPSPSPYPRSVASEQDNDFCDPRNLTVSSVDGDLSPELSALPSSLCASGDVEDDFVLKVEPQSADSAAIDIDQSLTGDLPGLEDFPDLESEVDFVNGLVNLGGDLSTSPAVASPSAADLASRSRASSSLSSASDFECDQFFSTWESSLETETQHANKRQRTASGSVPVMTSAADSATGNAEKQPTATSNDHSSASDSSSNSAGSASPENTGSADVPVAVPTNRRGRKQSLTEDPSKIFACDLCNRRFRRQEHLKRHYRSLHTQEKPFSCHECGKKFSRSDNLAQHARTHGAGAFVMNLYDDPEIVAAATAGYPPHPMYAPAPVPMGEDYASMGRVLFQVAAEIPGSSSELSSDDGSINQSKKKRKRAD